MILSLLAFIVVVVATFFVFKTAGDMNRNRFLWSAINLAVGLGFQFVIPLIVLVLLVVVMRVSGTARDKLEEGISGPAFFIYLAGILLSFIGMFLVLRHVAKLPEDDPVVIAPPPPPPPNFS